MIIDRIEKDMDFLRMTSILPELLVYVPKNFDGEKVKMDDLLASIKSKGSLLENFENESGPGYKESERKTLVVNFESQVRQIIDYIFILQRNFSLSTGITQGDFESKVVFELDELDKGKYANSIVNNIEKSISELVSNISEAIDDREEQAKHMKKKENERLNFRVHFKYVGMGEWEYNIELLDQNITEEMSEEMDVSEWNKCIKEEIVAAIDKEVGYTRELIMSYRKFLKSEIGESNDFDGILNNFTVDQFFQLKRTIENRWYETFANESSLTHYLIKTTPLYEQIKIELIDRIEEVEKKILEVTEEYKDKFKIDKMSSYHVIKEISVAKYLAANFEVGEDNHPNKSEDYINFEVYASMDRDSARMNFARFVGDYTSDEGGDYNVEKASRVNCSSGDKVQLYTRKEKSYNEKTLSNIKSRYFDNSRLIRKQVSHHKTEGLVRINGFKYELIDFFSIHRFQS